ncbi:hypothetical protein BFL40_29820 [Pseudomonas costantinii]|uniref:DNA polymerase V subunit UmuC n=1 Tax=Pseudomonas costantinii TaxID=168469 RepID=A0A1S2UE29_9PSED|nr:hypothetical protein BFL40_29820 [Pseudomonas costantinii]
MVNITNPAKRDSVLRNTDVAEVWGVGRKMKLHLDALGIKSAMDLAKADPWTLRKKFSVVIEKTARELAGTSSHTRQRTAPARPRRGAQRMLNELSLSPMPATKG